MWAALSFMLRRLSGWECESDVLWPPAEPLLVFTAQTCSCFLNEVNKKNTRQTKIWWAPHLHVSPPQKKINNAWPVAWTNSRTQSDFFSAGSLSLCICNSKSARGDLNEENLLCPPGQRLVQKSGSQLNPLLTPCHLPGSFSFSPGLAGDPSEALFAAGAAKNLLGEMKVAQRKNQPTTANVSFRPVWTNQEQICHLVFSLHAKLHQSEQQNKAREKNHLSEADQWCQDINDVWRRGRSFSSLFQSDVCLFSLQGSFLLLNSVFTHQQGSTEVNILISTILHISHRTKNISRTNKDNFFHSPLLLHDAKTCTEVKDVGGLVLTF